VTLLAKPSKRAGPVPTERYPTRAEPRVAPSTRPCQLSRADLLLMGALFGQLRFIRFHFRTENGFFACPSRIANHGISDRGKLTVDRSEAANHVNDV
jgi:hypothetical protein